MVACDSSARRSGREAEVHETNDALAVPHDVGGLEVAVEDAEVMDGAQTVESLKGHVVGFFGRERPLCAHQLTQVGASDELHGDVAERALLTILVDGTDVAMSNPPRQLDLGVETDGDRFGRCDLGTQDLEGNGLIEDAVLGLVDDAHAAVTQDALHLVASRDHGSACEHPQGLAAIEADRDRSVVVVKAAQADHGTRLLPPDPKKRHRTKL